MLLLHLSLVPLGYLIVFALRFDVPIPDPYQKIFWQTLPFLLVIRLASFSAFGLYHGWWRHVGMRDLLSLFKSVTASSAIFLIVLFMTGQLTGFPRSVIALDWLIAIFLFGGLRFAVRAFRESKSGFGRTERRARPALVVGAGEAAERLLRQLQHGGGDFRAVGLLDDDPAKRGMRLHGVPVLGSTRDLPRVAREQEVSIIVIAVPSASREQMQRIVDQCIRTRKEFKIVPPLLELLDGRARVSQLRNVEIEDLLGRQAVQLDMESIRRDIADKVVLITGGAGSIGSELARQIASASPDRLILVEQAESALYFAHLELQKKYPELEIIPVIADVTDAARIDRIFSGYKPHYVFHAAAYKHVPLMERNVVEAVRNNVFGTMYVATAAAHNGAEKFVLISTDKAVRPSSVMGATKWIAEQIVLGWPDLQRSRTDFRAVRFGNVLGSDGSVLPLFRQQLKAGGPLTVTHPEVTRYFMTIPEAVQLVLQAAALPEAAGRISMLDMGEPVRIVDLAEKLITLSGLQPYKDVAIVFSGMRPGEKLHEELVSPVEETLPTSVEKIQVVRTDPVRPRALEEGLDSLAAAMAVGGTADMLEAVFHLAPDCTPEFRARVMSASPPQVGQPSIRISDA